MYPLCVLRPTLQCVFEKEVFQCPQNSKAMLDIIFDNDLAIPATYKARETPPIYNEVLIVNSSAPASNGHYNQ